MIFTQRPVNYEQTDKRWKNIMYSNHGDKRQTIGTSGCGPTCAAMVISELTGKAVYPTETCDWAVKHNYRTYNDGTDFAYFVPQLKEYGITATYTWDKGKAEQALRNGKMVIGRALKGLWTTSGHFILAYKIEGSTIYINDPNSTATSREKALLSTWKAQVAPYWIVEDDWMIDKREIKISVDGKQQEMTAVLVDDENYIRLRDIGPALGYAVGYDAAKKMPVLKKE